MRNSFRNNNPFENEAVSHSLGSLINVHKCKESIRKLHCIIGRMRDNKEVKLCVSAWEIATDCKQVIIYHIHYSVLPKNK